MPAQPVVFNSNPLKLPLLFTSGAFCLLCKAAMQHSSCTRRLWPVAASATIFVLSSPSTLAATGTDLNCGLRLGPTLPADPQHAALLLDALCCVVRQVP